MNEFQNFPKSAPLDSPRTPKKKSAAVRILITLIVLALAGGLVTTGYLYYKTREQLKQLSTIEGQEVLAKQEVNQIVGDLSQLTLLPAEEPVIATILDEQYLATQSAFYKDAQKGDKIVIYRTAQKAFIYSPSRDIIVNSGPLILDQEATDKNAPLVKLEIRNGSRTGGAGTKLADELKTEGFEVTTIGTAINQEYPGTVIYSNNSNITPENMQSFADRINAEIVTSLPQGEPATQADMLIIIGNQ